MHNVIQIIVVVAILATLYFAFQASRTSKALYDLTASAAV